MPQSLQWAAHVPTRLRCPPPCPRSASSASQRQPTASARLQAACQPRWPASGSAQKRGLETPEARRQPTSCRRPWGARSRAQSVASLYRRVRLCWEPAALPAARPGSPIHASEGRRGRGLVKGGRSRASHGGREGVLLAERPMGLLLVGLRPCRSRTPPAPVMVAAHRSRGASQAPCHTGARLPRVPPTLSSNPACGYRPVPERGWAVL